MQYRLAVRRFLEFGSERTLLNGRGCMLTVVASVTAASIACMAVSRWPLAATAQCYTHQRCSGRRQVQKSTTRSQPIGPHTPRARIPDRTGPPPHWPSLSLAAHPPGPTLRRARPRGPTGPRPPWTTTSNGPARRQSPRARRMWAPRYHPSSWPMFRSDGGGAEYVAALRGGGRWTALMRRGRCSLINGPLEKKGLLGLSTGYCSLSQC